jgi:hypothetical protein
MKPTRILIAASSLLFAVASLAPLTAHETSKPGEAKIERKAGPNGGRVITKVTPHVEFFVMADRKVKLTFLDDAGKPIEPAAQTATLTGGDRVNPTKLAFAKEGNALVSDKAFPEGKSLPAVLQIKVTPDAPVVTEKITVNMAKCPECKLSEYACICGH